MDWLLVIYITTTTPRTVIHSQPMVYRVQCEATGKWIRRNMTKDYGQARHAVACVSKDGEVLEIEAKQ